MKDTGKGILMVSPITAFHNVNIYNLFNDSHGDMIL